MRLVIVESPFGGGGDPEVVNRNIAYARSAVADCLRRGESPIASHLLLTQPGVLNDDLPEERKLGIAAGLAWYGVADACVAYVDLGISSGMEQGIARARKLKLRVEGRELGSGYGDTVETLAPYHHTFGGPGAIEGAGVKTLPEVLALGAASEASRIADALILEGTRQELLGNVRGGREIAAQGELLRRG